MDPWGETPTLEFADGHHPAETHAIARYFDQKHPGRKIMGKTPMEQGQDAIWDDHV